MSEQVQPRTYGKLLVLDKGQLFQEFVLTKREITIGREPGNDLSILHPEISRRHARLVLDGGVWQLENLSQANPVQVKGQNVTAPVRLTLNDDFVIGPYLIQLVVTGHKYVPNLPGTTRAVPENSAAPPAIPNPPSTSRAVPEKPGPEVARIPTAPPTARAVPSNMPPASPVPNVPPTARAVPGQSGPPSTGPLPSTPPTGRATPPATRPTGPMPPRAEVAGGASVPLGQASAPGFNTMVTPGIVPTLRVDFSGASREHYLTKDRMTIGREPDNDIVIPIRSVSRVHAYLTRTGTGFTISDNNSTNGLLYKGAYVKELLLNDGDFLRIGDAIGDIVTLSYDDPTHPLSGNIPPITFDVNAPSITIGRAADNLVVLPYPQVSAYHAVIERTPEGAVVRDLGSTNGTFVRGVRVRSGRAEPIKLGETLQIAGYQLTYQQGAIAQVGADQVRIDALGVGKVVNNGKLTLLNNISLSIQPKEFVAVVGGSGAGKSTLLNALNGFKPVELGKVLLNGDDYYQNFGAYRSSLGYVPQDDIIHRDLTVERALYYAAKMRLPEDTSQKEIKQRVAEVLEDVEIGKRAKLPVSKLSGGQRKRVSIAVELIAKPTLFFLDEPTSGLDPGLDKRMMFLLRRLADQGRTIILVTHATSNVNVCDKVVFLAPGGKLCFFGPPAEALKFFEVEEFADIYSKLEQTPTSGEEWEQRFRQSPYYQRYVVQPLSNLPKPAHATSVNVPPINPNQYGAADAAGYNAPQNPVKAPRISGWRQWWILTRRYIELVSRDRINMLVLLLQAPIIGIILALVAGGDAFGPGKSPVDAQTVLFMLAISSVWLGTSNAAREITKETPIYLRERLVNLRVFPYVMSKVVVLGVLCLVQTLLLGGIVMLRTGAPGNGALLPGGIELLIGIWLTTLGGLAMGLFVSALAANTDKATSIIPIILVPQIILAGLIFPLSGPSKALSFVTVSKWSLDALGTTANVNQLYYDRIKRGLPPGAPLVEPPRSPNSTFDPADYDINPSITKDYASTTDKISRSTSLLIRWGILAGMTVLFLGLTCYFQKRKDKAWEQHKKKS